MLLLQFNQVRNTFTARITPRRVVVEYQHFSFVLGKQAALSVCNGPSHIVDGADLERRHWIRCVARWSRHNRRLLLGDFDVGCVTRREQDQTTDKCGRRKDFVFLLSSHYELSDSSSGRSVCPLRSDSPGTRYSPSTHFPRSTSWHRTEQNGRYSLSFHSAGLPQVGHFIATRSRQATGAQTIALPAV